MTEGRGEGYKQCIVHRAHSCVNSLEAKLTRNPRQTVTGAIGTRSCQKYLSVQLGNGLGDGESPTGPPDTRRCLSSDTRRGATSSSFGE